MSTDLFYRRREYHRRRRRFCFICIYIYVSMLVSMYPPPLSLSQIILFFGAQNRKQFDFSWLKATQTINLMTHFPSPLLSPSIYIEDDRDEYLLILPGLHS
jgi:hypothetical protein